MTDKLKPCPFCGGEAIEARESRDESFGYCGINVIRCKDCPAMVSVSDPQDPNGWAERSGMPEAITAWNTRAADALEPSGDVVKRYRHVKRGTIYEIVGLAELKMSFDNLVDGSEMLVYRGDDGKMWVREESEFHDGRFQALGASHAE